MSVSDISNAAGAAWAGNQVDSVSGASTYVPATATTTDPAISQMRSDIQQNSQDFKALKSALNSNDLTAATQAFATLQQDIQTASTSAGGKSPLDPNSPIGKDFQAIGAALKSGDLSAAKQAFNSFKSDIKSAGRAARAHHHHLAASAANDGQTSTTTATTPATATSTVSGTLDAIA